MASYNFLPFYLTPFYVDDRFPIAMEPWQNLFVTVQPTVVYKFTL
jgi:hypothetical protein